MWHFFKNIFGEWEGYYIESPLEDFAIDAGGSFLFAAAMVVLMAIIGWFLQIMGAALYLPLACLLLIGFMFALFLISPNSEDSFGIYGMVAVSIYLLMYAWACVCFAMRGATAAAGEGWTSFGGLALFGLIMVVICAGMSEFIGPIAAVPLVAQFFIWWSTIAEDYSGPLPEQVLRITFRILGILVLVGLAVWVFDLVRGLAKAQNNRSTIGLLLMLGTGFAPLVVGGLLAGIKPYLGVAGTLAAYAILAIGMMSASKHIPVTGLAFAYLVLMLCYLLSQGNLSYLPPIEVPNAIMWAVANFPLTQLCGNLMVVVGSAFAEVGTTVLYPLGSLFMSIFESSMPSFHLPELVGCVLGFACVMLTLAIAQSAMAAGRRA